MPIRSYAGFHRLIGREKTSVPPHVLADLEAVKDDEEAVKEYGIKQGIQMCETMRAAGEKGFHFYTMNLEKSVRSIVEGLGFVAPIENIKPLPWKPSLSKKRKRETVRPIFWRNRNRSYIMRTQSWEDFPNGHWGDSRSVSYGELDHHGISLKCTPEEALNVWGTPKTNKDVSKLFSDFCKGRIASLPWCDEMAPESESIQTYLSNINMNGFLTINSQPAVDGAPSSDPRYGWGPKHGFVYQKSYVEFFVSPSALDKLIRKLDQNPHLTYHAVNKKGDLRANVECFGPNAITWGVFPNREIVQPTVVDADSFLAWKDEAYELWNKWAEIYPAGSESAVLLNGIADDWFLMNVVNNDYRDALTLFDILESNHI
ncbi:methylenetetrahydrofolate reductase-domain-containing protein, partial [Obelidium mucronatum]